MAKNTRRARTATTALVQQFSQAEVVLAAIAECRERYALTHPGKTIDKVHVVWGGVNKLLEKLYPGEEPRAITERLFQQRIIGLQVVRGGAIIWDPKDAPLPPILMDMSEAVAKRLQKK